MNNTLITSVIHFKTSCMVYCSRFHIIIMILFGQYSREHCVVHMRAGSQDRLQIGTISTAAFQFFFIDSDYCHNYLHALYVFECLS